jgi:hypothetical protein
LDRKPNLSVLKIFLGLPNVYLDVSYWISFRTIQIHSYLDIMNLVKQTPAYNKQMIIPLWFDSSNLILLVSWLLYVTCSTVHSLQFTVSRKTNIFTSSVIKLNLNLWKTQTWDVWQINTIKRKENKENLPFMISKMKSKCQTEENCVSRDIYIQNLLDSLFS